MKNIINFTLEYAFETYKDLYDVHMIFTWSSHDLHMIFTWASHDSLMRFPCIFDLNSITYFYTKYSNDLYLISYITEWRSLILFNPQSYFLLSQKGITKSILDLTAIGNLQWRLSLFVPLSDPHDPSDPSEPSARRAFWVPGINFPVASCCLLFHETGCQWPCNARALFGSSPLVSFVAAFLLFALWLSRRGREGALPLC